VSAIGLANTVAVTVLAAMPAPVVSIERRLNFLVSVKLIPPRFVVFW
jgi:hypothetical protein